MEHNPCILNPIGMKILFTKSPLGDLGVKRLQRIAGLTLIVVVICAKGTPLELFKKVFDYAQTDTPAKI